MRARGANMTDVVVLVVSAAEGVQPQTIESINHARAAGVPIVVAMNKIDRPDANAQQVLGQLAGTGSQPRRMGRRHRSHPHQRHHRPGHPGTDRNPRLPGRVARSQGRPDAARARHRHRSAHRSGPRPGRHRAGSGRHAQRRRRHALPAPATAASACCSTIAARASRKPARPRRSSSAASASCPTPATSSIVVDDVDRARTIAEERADARRARRSWPAQDQVTLDNLFEHDARPARSRRST